ncbi:hypothetical protein GEW_13221 [Pasteurella multocida subsp. gallicida str. Anand1_poultry]|nr:hypothetical protein GEW_13221 [Pasteurella multocida subsp. gallicida str. Anand1_poultry]
MKKNYAKSMLARDWRGFRLVNYANNTILKNGQK